MRKYQRSCRCLRRILSRNQVTRTCHVGLSVGRSRHVTFLFSAPSHPSATGGSVYSLVLSALYHEMMRTSPEQRTDTMHVADVCGVGDVRFVIRRSVESKWRNVDFLAAASSGHELRFAIQFACSLCVSVEIIQTRVCLTFRLSRVHL